MVFTLRVTFISRWPQTQLWLFMHICWILLKLNNNVILLWFRISKALESIPGQVKNQVEYSQFAESIVIQARTIDWNKFVGVECNRVELEFNHKPNRLIQSPIGFVFVCGEPDNDTASYMKLVSCRFNS